MKDSFWQWEEIFIGACLQFPLYFIMGWSVIPTALICGVLWRLGGWTHGHKAFRWAVVPLFVCFCAFMCTKNQWIFLAAPFMVKIAPSYGKSSWLYKWVKRHCAYAGWATEDQRANFLTRILCYFWYWAAFSIAFIL